MDGVLDEANLIFENATIENSFLFWNTDNRKAETVYPSEPKEIGCISSIIFDLK